VVVINLDLLKKIPSEEINRIAERRKQCFTIVSSYSEPYQLDNLKALVTESISLDEPKQLVQKKVKSVICKVASLEEQPAEGAELSEREIEILKDVALGLSNKEIAEKNFISPHTVITHRKNITRKLGIKTVSGLTIYAILNKLIGMEALK
jgi:DNA-binding NarL/FixJ family response regulator